MVELFHHLCQRRVILLLGWLLCLVLRRAVLLEVQKFVTDLREFEFSLVQLQLQLYYLLVLDTDLLFQLRELSLRGLVW